MFCTIISSGHKRGKGIEDTGEWCNSTFVVVNNSFHVTDRVGVKEHYLFVIRFFVAHVRLWHLFSRVSRWRT